MNPFLRRNWFMVKNQLGAMVATVGIEESERSMIGPSKILTVSYGTFSCTLEGFDEPFATMKAIAEYFRDLAADDRYFGAEPPQPDAEMLHRIAERQIQRRVESRIGTNGITLRAEAPAAPDAGEIAHDAAPAAPPAPMVAEAPLAQSVQAASATGPAASDEITQSVAAKLARIRAAVAGARATVALSTYEDEAGADDAMVPMPDADFGFDIELDDVFQQTPDHEQPLTGDETGAAPLAQAQELAGADQPEAATAESAPAPEPPATAPAAVAAETENVVLNRRAARRAARTAAGLAAMTSVAQPAPADQGATKVAAADHAEPTEAGENPPQTADLQQASGTADLAPAIDLPEPQAPLAAPPAESHGITPQAEVAAEPATVPDEAEGQAEVAAEPVAAPAEAEAEVAAEPATVAAEAEGQAAAQPSPLAPEAAEDIWPEPATEDLATEAISPPQPLVRARVIKVRRSEALAASDNDDAAVAAEDAEAAEAAEDEAAADAAQSDEDTLAAVGAALAEPQPEPESPAAVVLSPEAEAELARELAELEAEIAPANVFEAMALDDTGLSDETADDENLFDALAGVAARQRHDQAADAVGESPEDILDATAATPLDEADSDTKTAEAPAAPSPPRDAAADPAEANLSRLLTETNSKLEGPENRRRFSAIAHLKAAVAATVADRKLQSPDEAAAAKADEVRALERYREDLTKAVRPRRPATGVPEAATRRPAVPETRPAPLVLVSEQRIDRPQDAVSNAPHIIRPRRISAAQAVAVRPDYDDDEESFDDTPLSPSEARNFADYARKLGARELPELLEAAAAFVAHVEGQPHFTRPHLIRKVSALAAGSGYDREAGLRSFGTLLRQGKIAKVKRGQFAITEASRYYPPQARAR